MPPSRRSSPQTKTDPTQRGSRGSISLLLAVVVCIVVSCCVAVVHVGGRVIVGARTQSAADSVALAMVMRDRAIAAHVAEMLDVIVVSVRDDGNVVSIVVRKGSTVRSSTAQRAVTDNVVPSG